MVATEPKTVLASCLRIPVSSSRDHSKYLWSSHICLVQPKAARIEFFSDATFDVLYCFHKKFHSSSPPFLTAVQYTIFRKSLGMLQNAKLLTNHFLIVVGDYSLHVRNIETFTVLFKQFLGIHDAVTDIIFASPRCYE